MSSKSKASKTAVSPLMKTLATYMASAAKNAAAQGSCRKRPSTICSTPSPRWFRARACCRVRKPSPMQRRWAAHRRHWSSGRTSSPTLNRPRTSTACWRMPTRLMTRTHPRCRIPAARSCPPRWRWANAKNRMARSFCAPSRWVMTSARASTCRCTPMTSARSAIPRTASARASAPRRPRRCWQA